MPEEQLKQAAALPNTPENMMTIFGAEVCSCPHVFGTQACNAAATHVQDAVFLWCSSQLVMEVAQ